MFANQIWLLAKDVSSVLFDNPFSRHILTDEVTGNTHPNTSCIMYVSLSRLSKEKSVAGELARFLLGKSNDDIGDEVVKQVMQQFSTSFEAFKADKEVATAMLVKDRFLEEGIEKGLALGEIKYCFTKLKRTVSQIADEFGISEEDVTNALEQLGLA
jgi:hypothetical protein